MPESRHCVALAIALALTLPAVLTAQQAEGTYHLTGGNYAVFNLAGRMSVEAGSGSSLAVEVHPQGADADRLRVVTGDIRGQSTLRVLYPDGDIVYPAMASGGGTQIQVREDGTFGDGGRQDREVRIRNAGSGTRASADVRLLLPAGSSLDLHLGAGGVTVRNVEGNLSVDVSAASVDVDGVTGNFSLDAGSAPIKLARVRGKEISLDTGSGSIVASNISATSLSLDTGSGAASFDGLAVDEVSLDTGSGAVTLALDTDVDELSLDSGSGNVTIYAPATLGAQLAVDGGSGKIDVQLPLADRHDDEDGNSLSGTLGDGKGTITIDSGSGDVRILPR